jgi:hypothetical protein
MITEAHPLRFGINYRLQNFTVSPTKSANTKVTQARAARPQNAVSVESAVIAARRQTFADENVFRFVAKVNPKRNSARQIVAGSRKMLGNAARKAYFVLDFFSIKHLLQKFCGKTLDNNSGLDRIVERFFSRCIRLKVLKSRKFPAFGFSHLWNELFRRYEINLKLSKAKV